MWRVKRTDSSVEGRAMAFSSSWTGATHGLRNELIQGRNLSARDRAEAEMKRAFSLANIPYHMV